MTYKLLQKKKRTERFGGVLTLHHEQKKEAYVMGYPNSESDEAIGQHEVEMLFKNL